MKKQLYISLLCFFTVLITPAISQEVKRDVIYVPTPYKVVAEMLKVAEVEKTDVLYDLGCGDGRIVIHAAQRGARATGIDIDPVRIAESKQNAIRFQVTERVRFLNQNLFETDISEATVLSLYLLPRLNLKLRPKIFKELKPGTRIVSHDFDMGDWQADKSLEVVENYSHHVYFWIVPANVSGRWTWQANEGKETYTMELKQHFQVVQGFVRGANAQYPLRNPKLQGNLLQFTLEQTQANRSIVKKFQGKVNGNSLEGTIMIDNQSHEWKAQRVPATITPFFLHESQ